MDRWDSFVHRVCKILLLIAGVVLAFMFLFTLFSVARRGFGTPIVGDYEVISFLGAIVVGFSLPSTSLFKGHVFVDFLLVKLPLKASNNLQIATRVLGLALFLWIGWNFVGMSLDLIRSKEVSQMFRLPFYPISLGLAFTCLIQCCTFVSQIKEILGGRHG